MASTGPGACCCCDDGSSRQMPHARARAAPLTMTEDKSECTVGPVSAPQVRDATSVEPLQPYGSPSRIASAPSAGPKKYLLSRWTTSVASDDKDRDNTREDAREGDRVAEGKRRIRPVLVHYGAGEPMPAKYAPQKRV